MYSSCIWSFLNSSVSLSIHPSIYLPSIHVLIHNPYLSSIYHPSSIHTDMNLFIHLIPLSTYYPSNLYSSIHHASSLFIIHPCIYLSIIHPSLSSIHISIHPPSSHTYFYLSIYPPMDPSLPSIHLSMRVYVQRIHGKSPIATCYQCQYPQQMRCFLTSPFRPLCWGKKRVPRKVFTHSHERKDSTPKKAQDLSSHGCSVACV